MARYAIFRVSLNKPAEETVVVNYATIDGTASALDGDYTSTSGTLTFAEGEQEKEIAVLVRDASEDEIRPPGTFSVTLSSPSGGILGAKRTGTITLPGTEEQLELTPYIERFRVIYDALHNPANEYFGPTTGSPLRVIPMHVSGLDSMLLNEAPDYSGQTVSETASFWIGLEAWNAWVTAQETGTPDWSGYVNAWEKVDEYWIPPLKAGNMAVYDPQSPADYIPNANSPTLYPRLTDLSAPVGVDPLWNELSTQYSSKRMYLMHWILDVEGAYGFKNWDGSNRAVYINTYQRGLQESSFETVTHPTWNDWKNGGGPYGYEPLFTKGAQVYPEAPFDYGKKWSYTCAPDAEVRSIQWAYFAEKVAAEVGGASEISAVQKNAKKLADYTRYSFFDKYFRQIGNNTQGGTNADPYASCHFLISWYVSWGGEVVTEDDPYDPDRDPFYNYLVSCSECHQGYQAVNTAFYCAKGGAGFTPDSPSAGDTWLGALYRQIEMIRWLQSPEGPIAGGVTNSMFDQYATVTDGREKARFYGMDYVYSPVWHDPVSNNWVGFQGWGQGRTAELFLETSTMSTQLANNVRPNVEIILDRLVVWFLKETSFDGDTMSIPATLSWASPTQIPGVTANEPNLEGVYEYLPTLDWDDNGDYADFWAAHKVPNPNLHCTVTDYGEDLGVASSMAYLLLTYAKAKQNLGKFTSFIPNSSYTAKDAYVCARRILDRTWKRFDGIGVCVDEERSDYIRMADEVYIPSEFSGTMPNGDKLEPGATFISIRTFLKEDPKWAEVEAFINGTGPAPVFRYHRFWAQCEFAIACAAMARHFGDYIESDTDYIY